MISRRTRWRAAVYRAPSNHKTYGIPNAVRVLLLRLLEDMNANGIVSVPRSILAADLGVDPRRITERIAVAKQAGWLTVVKHGGDRTTAVYQAMFPDDWTEP